MATEKAAGSSPADAEITTAGLGQTTNTETEAPAIQPDANSPAPSSSADTTTADAKDDRSTALDLTLEALGKKDAEPTEKSSTSEADKGEKTAPAEAKADDGKDKAEAEDPDKKLPFHEHPRWKEVTSENKTLKEQNASLTADVTEFRAIEEFRTSNNLEPVEVADGYKIMALLKNTPEEALPYLEGLVSDLRKHAGLTLPDDIQQDVDAGAITEERALELSQARARSASTDARLAQQQRTETENRQAARVGEFQTAGADWAAKMQLSDPEFAEKEPMVAERMAKIMRDEPNATPKSPGDVAKLAERALADVNKRLSGMGRKSTPPVPVGVSAPASPARTGPMTPHEITMAALAQTG
jgi:hypothetical protein